MSNRAVIKVGLRIDEQGVVRGLKNVGRESTEAGSKGADAFKKMDLQTSALNRSMKLTTATIAKMGAGIAALVGAAGVGSLGLMAQRTTEATVEIYKNSQMAGVGAQAYQELAYAAGKYHVSTDALTDGLKELNLRAEEFVFTGAGPGQEAFERLGYSQEELNRKLRDTPSLLTEIINRMQGMENAAKMRIADEIFGGQGGEQFVAMINGGALALENFKIEARELGVVMDDEMIRQILRAKTEVNRLVFSLSNQFNIIVAELAPDIADVATAMGDWVKANRELIGQNIKSVMDDVKDGAASAYEVLGDIKNIYDSIPSEITGAAGTGLIGSFFFGGKIGLVISALTLADNLTSKMGMGLGDLVRKQKEGMEVRDRLLKSLGMQEADYHPEDGMERFYRAMGIVSKPIDVNTPGYNAYKGISSFPINSSTPGYGDYTKDSGSAASGKPVGVDKDDDKWAMPPVQQIDYWGESYDTDYGQDPVAAAIQKRELALNNEAIALQRNIELQNRMAEAMDDTYDVDYGAVTDGLEEMAAQEQRIYEEFQTAYKSATMTATEFELDQLKERYDAYAKTIDDKQKLDEWYAAQSKRITEKHTNDWKNAFSGWGRDFSRTLNDMLWNSKISFESIAESFGRMITQMVLQKKAVEPLMQFADWGMGQATDWVSSFFGGGSASPVTLSNGAIINPSGVVYGMAGGGIINEHVVGFGLKSGASYEFGEGGIPEAVVPKKYWGGQRESERVTVVAGGVDLQVIDQRSSRSPALEVSESQDQNGRKQIRMLIRGEVSGAFNDGSLDRTMQTNYGLKRRGFRR